MDKNLVSKRLAEAINNSGMTKSEIAKKMGKSQSTITDYSLRGVMPSIPALYDLCKVLGISADYILGLEDF